MWCSPPSTPCPTPWSATLSWRPWSCCPIAGFDPEAFDRFLARQEDLGTKWAPRYVRIAEHLPVTATNKILKRVVRSERWHTDDPVWWKPERDGPYTRLTPHDAAALDAALDAADMDRPI